MVEKVHLSVSLHLRAWERAAPVQRSGARHAETFGEMLLDHTSLGFQLAGGVQVSNFQESAARQRAGECMLETHLSSADQLATLLKRPLHKSISDHSACTGWVEALHLSAAHHRAPAPIAPVT
jgi:hypothetical protein